MNTRIVINNDLINEALEIGNFSSKKELLEVALKNFIENQKRKKILEIKGKIEFSPDYDYKSMRGLN